MPDAPDWYMFLPGSDRYVLGDMGELAVRLGSPHTYDRRGEVIWYDFFEYGLNRWRSSASGGGSATKDTTVTYWGENQIALVADDPLQGGQVIVDKYFAVPYLSKWGIEVVIAFENAFDWFAISITNYDGVDAHKGQVRLNNTTKQLQYRASGGAWTDVGAIDNPAHTTTPYHHLKLVVDYNTNELVRCLYDATVFDVAGLGVWEFTSGEGPYNHVELTFQGVKGADSDAKLGAVILTSNEP